MVLSFEAQKPFVGDRMGRTIREVFGQEPICFRVPVNQYGWGGLVFVAGNLEGARKQLAANPRLAGAIAQWQKDKPVVLTGKTPIARRWPTSSADRVIPRSIPARGLDGAVGPLCAVGSLREVIMAGSRSPALLLPGAAFLLLEVQNINKASVVLGNTWLVNAVIISGSWPWSCSRTGGARLPSCPTWVYGGLSHLSPPG